MDSNLIQILLLFLSTAYVTHVLLLERKVSHYGPFPSKDLVVFFPADEEEEESHIQPVTLFDWIRRPFGVYKVERHVWTVVQAAPAERWTCPICLSFWIAAVMLLLRFFIPPEIFQQVTLLLSMACAASLINVNGLP